MAALAPLPAARGRCRAAPPAPRCAHAHAAGQGPPQRPHPAVGRSRRAGQGRHPAPGTRPAGPPPPRYRRRGGGTAGPPPPRSRPRPLRTSCGSAPPPQQAGRLRRGRQCSAGRKAQQPAAPPAATIFHLLLLLPPPAPPGPAPPAAPPSRVSAPARSLPPSLRAGEGPDGGGRCRPGAPAGPGLAPLLSSRGLPVLRSVAVRAAQTWPLGRHTLQPGSQCLSSSERDPAGHRPVRLTSPGHGLPSLCGPGGRRLPPPRRCESCIFKCPLPKCHHILQMKTSKMRV
ncbi:uncharacterized protein LOC134564507 [Prinia subflava]|uniref:uncharacterized protein LOC134564507 n=1 Tax=Prinia subflava TaxID=208062 RepID=UPI002FE3E7A4